jgi:DNA replication protein DnaC
LPAQRLQVARRELESALAKLDKYHLPILDDIAYVNKDQAETSVLFKQIGSRYERYGDHLGQTTMSRILVIEDRRTPAWRSTKNPTRAALRIL